MLLLTARENAKRKDEPQKYYGSSGVLFSTTVKCVLLLLCQEKFIYNETQYFILGKNQQRVL